MGVGILVFLLSWVAAGYLLSRYVKDRAVPNV
jgi:hypothetical protein